MASQSGRDASLLAALPCARGFSGAALASLRGAGGVALGVGKLHARRLLGPMAPAPRCRGCGQVVERRAALARPPRFGGRSARGPRSSQVEPKVGLGSASVLHKVHVCMLY